MNWISVKKYPFENLKGDREFYKENYQLFIDAFEFDEWSYYERVKDLKKFLSNDVSYNAGKIEKSKGYNEINSWIDHARFFRNKDLGRTWLVCQPYGYELKDIKCVVENLNLVAYPLNEICGFYYMKGTTPIIVMSPEDSNRFFIDHDGMKKKYMIGV